MAQYDVAVAYANGLGVTQNYEEAKRWFERAAKQDNPHAQNSLGITYSKGEGVHADYDVALVSFSLAAAQDNSEALANRDSLAKIVTAEQVQAAEQTAARMRAGQGFSTVEGEVHYTRNLFIWRNCSIAEFNKQSTPKTDRAVAVMIALQRCDYIREALIGDLLRIDPEMDEKRLRATMNRTAEDLRRSLLLN